MANTTAPAGTSEEGNQNPSAGDSGKSFTQEGVNKMMAEQKSELKAKYADHDKYKAAYEEAQQRAEAEKSDLEKETERANAAEARANALQAEKEQAAWKAAASKSTGVPIEALHGSSEEEINECAESLKGYFQKPAAPHVQTGTPSTDEGSATGDPLRDAIFGNK